MVLGRMVLRNNLEYCEYCRVAFREKQEYIPCPSRKLSPVLHGNDYSFRQYV